jgi:hypothetical protein
MFFNAESSKLTDMSLSSVAEILYWTAYLRVLHEGYMRAALSSRIHSGAFMITSVTEDKITSAWPRKETLSANNGIL